MNGKDSPYLSPTGGNEPVCWDNGSDPWNFLFEYRRMAEYTEEYADYDKLDSTEYENLEMKRTESGASSVRARLSTRSTTYDSNNDSTDDAADGAGAPESSGSPRENSTEAEWPLEATEGDDGTICNGGRYGRGNRKLSHQSVPKNTNLGQSFGGTVKPENDITTLMIRNIPNMYTRSMLMEELDSLDFRTDYDFIYVPIDKSTQWNVGYAFVNFKTPEAAVRCMDVVTNYTFTRFEHGSGKVAQVSIAHIQGLERNLEYYSKTAVQCARITTHRPLQLNAKMKEAAAAESSRKAHRRRRRLRLVGGQDNGDLV
jgi:hypothetical protein